MFCAAGSGRCLQATVVMHIRGEITVAQSLVALLLTAFKTQTAVI